MMVNQQKIAIRIQGAGAGLPSYMGNLHSSHLNFLSNHCAVPLCPTQCVL